MDTPTKPVYFRPDYAPHLELFHCAPLRIDLSPAACGRQHGEQDRYPCGICPIGAMHAARERIVVHASNKTTGFARPCVRCEVGTFRLVAGRLCPSCYNRQREWFIGRNKKGGRPTIRLFTWEVLLIAPSGISPVTGQFSGIDGQHLGDQDYSVRITALHLGEVRRTIAALWPHTKVVVIEGVTAPIEATYGYPSESGG